VRALIKSGKWKLKAITRNKETSAAKELASKGVEVVECDMLNKSKLTEVLKNVHGAFLLTDFWANPDMPEHEVLCGKTFGDAAKEANISHLVYSTMPSTKKLLGYPVTHLETKAEVSNYLKSLNLPLTEVVAAFYYENFKNIFHPKQNETGDYVLSLPMGDKPMDMISCEDVGPVVSYVLDHREETLGKYYPLCGDRLTISQVADTFKKVIGWNVKYVPVPMDEFKKSRESPYMMELGDMFQCFQDTSGGKLCDLQLSKRIYPNIKSLADWLKEGHFKEQRA